MTAPITPDERATMRERYEPGPMGSPERIDIGRKASQGLTARVDVPRLLDALDAAEYERDEESVAARRNLERAERAEAEVARLLAERTAAHADDATCASCTHEYVADMERRVEEAEARVSPAWDEDTVTEAVVRDHQPPRPDLQTFAAAMSRAFGPALSADTTSVEVAVVREHLPVSGESRAQVQSQALRDAAATFAARLPDGTGNGRAYNSHQVADMLTARADRIEKGETP